MVLNGNEEVMLRTREVARLFHAHPKTVGRWAREGKLPTVRTPGGHFRYPASAVRKILEGCGFSPNPVANEKPVVLR